MLHECSDGLITTLHTRSYAYKWSHDTKQTVQLPMHLPSLVAIPPNAAPNKIPNKQHSLYERVETNPGVAEAITDRTGRKLSKEALGPLLEWARAVVPRRQRKCTPGVSFEPELLPALTGLACRLWCMHTHTTLFLFVRQHACGVPPPQCSCL